MGFVFNFTTSYYSNDCFMNIFFLQRHFAGNVKTVIVIRIFLKESTLGITDIVLYISSHVKFLVVILWKSQIVICCETTLLKYNSFKVLCKIMYKHSSAWIVQRKVADHFILIKNSFRLNTNFYSSKFKRKVQLSDTL